MKRNRLEQGAYLAGLTDARVGRVYRHSAAKGTRTRDWLDHYEAGWNKGRKYKGADIPFGGPGIFGGPVRSK